MKKVRLSREMLMSCHPVFAWPTKVQKVEHSATARIHQANRSKESGCRTWIDLLAWKIRGEKP